MKKTKFLGYFYGDEVYGNDIAEKALKQFETELNHEREVRLRQKMGEFWNHKPKSFIQRLLGK